MMRLHYETVVPLLRKTLNDIMGNSAFEPFYLVGGAVGASGIDRY